MGFWDGLLNVVGDLMDGYAASKTYPTLQDVIGKYFGKGYNLSSCSTFSATLVAEVFFGDKTVDLLVLDNGAVSVTESGLMGDEYVYPPVPPPEEFMRLLREQEASSPSSSASNSGTQSDSHQRQEKPDLSETTLFAILGKLCIADGPVNSTEEARIAELAEDVCDDDSSNGI